MPRVSATRRASYTSSIEQQRPWTDSGMPSCPAMRRWFQSCMVSPMTGCPSARSMAATVEESTPPDMATAMGGVLCMLRNLGVLHSNTAGAYGQDPAIRHKKHPEIIPLIRILEIVSGRNDQLKIVEDKRGSSTPILKLDAA